MNQPFSPYFLYNKNMRCLKLMMTFILMGLLSILNAQTCDVTASNPIANDVCGQIDTPLGVTTNSSGIWTKVSGNGTIENETMANGVIYKPSVADFGNSVTVKWTTTGNSPCTEASVEVTFDVNEPVLVSNGLGGEICGIGSNTLSVVANVPGSIGEWTVISGAGTISNETSSTNASYNSVEADFGNTIEVLWTADDPDGNVPCTASTAQVGFSVFQPPIDGGEIATTDTQRCNKNGEGTDPNDITSVTDGSGDGNISYTWEKSTNTTDCSDGDWMVIAGATGVSYNPPAGLMETTHYRRKATATVTLTSPPNQFTCSAYSNCVSVYVGIVNKGEIAGDQTICAGGTPSTISSVVDATVGPDNTLSYRWQMITASNGNCDSPNDDWTTVNGAASKDYIPGTGNNDALTETTYYRRVARATVTEANGDTYNCNTVSNCVVVNVNPRPTVTLRNSTLDVCARIDANRQTLNVPFIFDFTPLNDGVDEFTLSYNGVDNAFSDLNGTVNPASSGISIIIISNTVPFGTYTFDLKVRNSTTGCESEADVLTLNVLPQIGGIRLSGQMQCESSFSIDDNFADVPQEQIDIVENEGGTVIKRIFSSASTYNVAASVDLQANIPDSDDDFPTTPGTHNIWIIVYTAYDNGNILCVSGFPELTYTINFSPEISGRDTTVCMDAMVDLSSLISGTILDELEYGTTYGTYGGPSTVQVVNTTTYYVRDSVEATGCVDTAQITVTVNPNPEISGRDTTVCMDAMVDLSSLISGTILDELEYGSNYGTYGGSSMVQAINTTTYYVRDSVEATGCVDTAQITVEVITTMECLMSFRSDNVIKFDDPCICDQVERVDRIFYFRDTLVISAPTGQVIRYSTANSSNFYSQPGVLMVDGTLIEETSPGIYKLEFYKSSGEQATGSVTLNGGDPFQIPEEDLPLCDVFASCPALVPTLGQWGVIVLGLLFLIIGLVTMKVPIRSPIPD